jgi:hypothetical protein
MSDDNPIALDSHRGMAAQKATEIRRRLSDVDAHRAALQERQAEFEKFLLAAPSHTWPELGEKARYLLTLFAETSVAQDPRRQKLIESVLEDIRRLSDETHPHDFP